MKNGSGNLEPKAPYYYFKGQGKRHYELKFANNKSEPTPAGNSIRIKGAECDEFDAKEYKVWFEQTFFAEAQSSEEAKEQLLRVWHDRVSTMGDAFYEVRDLITRLYNWFRTTDGDPEHIKSS